MRRNRDIQMPLTMRKTADPIADEFEVISRILDENPIIDEMAAKDLCAGKSATKGCKGMTGEQVVRAALVMRLRGLSYRVLRFELLDSRTLNAFSRLPFDSQISFKALAENIKRLRPETWEAILRVIVGAAGAKKIETGRVIATDTAAIKTDIHRPTDSTLLADCVRVITRLAKRAAPLFMPGRAPVVADHNRAAKRLVLAIVHARNEKKRRKLYRKLISLAEKSVQYGYGIAVFANTQLSNPLYAVELQAAAKEIDNVCSLAQDVIGQAARRVLRGENVPADEKIVSIFETHSDVIVKDRREVVFGHKACFTMGKSGLILDCILERGNPADAALYEKVLERHVAQFGRPPKQTAADGGFASKANLAKAKQKGVVDAVFHKKRGLSESDMARSPWIYRKLKNFRAGIEAALSWGMRSFGLDRCAWKGWESFQAYVLSGLVAHNLLVMARFLLPKKAVQRC